MAALQANGQLLSHVDPLVGTDHSVTDAAGLFGKGTEELGQTLPAVLSPHGMNFWTPQTRDTERKCVAPYYYADTLLQGFRNSHFIVGGCTQDYGSFTIMPMSHALRCSPAARASRFSHNREEATPYCYSVALPDEGLTAEMTGTSRAAIFRFAYPYGGKAYIAVSPNSDEGQGLIAIDTAACAMRGYNPVHRIYQGKGEPAGFSGHFIVQFDRKPSAYGVYQGDEPMPGTAYIAHRPEIGGYFEFDLQPGDTLLVKAASSFVDAAGAESNLMAEIPGWDFDEVKENLRQQWESHLSAVQVNAGDEADKNKLYTAMYHASFLPHAISDADGRYPAFASGYPIMQMPEGQEYFDGYSMWDTYRALHPLLNLLRPDLSAQMMQSLVLKYEQGGWMPIFPCWNSYTSAMIGDHCASAIADAWLKGVGDFDIEKAYEGLRKNAFESPSDFDYQQGKGRRGLKSYLKYGYIPLEDSVPYAYHKREQASRTLEYAYDDYALAQIAKALGRDNDYAELMRRSKNYANAINPATGYADGRHADGSWQFARPDAFAKCITEGAPCHYAWYVPHDPEGLMQIMGGEKAFVAKLDSMFEQRRYWHGNEPCHQIAYMYAYAGERDKCAQRVREIIDREYKQQPGGLAGNDDAGQMSAWLIFSALGFYPMCPASDEYVLGCPLFDDITLNLPNGRVLNIIAKGASKGLKSNRRNPLAIKEIRLNGKPIAGPAIKHADIMQGGTLEFKLK